MAGESQAEQPHSGGYASVPTRHPALLSQKTRRSGLLHPPCGGWFLDWEKSNVAGQSIGFCIANALRKGLEGGWL